MNPPALPEVERALNDVLSRPEFSYEPSLLERVLTWIGRILSDFFSLLFANGKGLSVWGWLVAVALAAALVYACVRVGRRGSRKGRRREGRARDLPDEPTTPAGLLARADALAADGAPSPALGLLMAALLAQFQANGLLKLQPGRTNRQYLSDLRRAGRPETSFFEAFCRDFNRFRYGGTPVAPSDYDGWRGRIAAVVLAPERRAG